MRKSFLASLAVLIILVVIFAIVLKTKQSPNTTPEQTNNLVEQYPLPESVSTIYRDAILGASFSYYTDWSQPELHAGDDKHQLFSQVYLDGEWRPFAFLEAQKSIMQDRGAGPTDIGYSVTEENISSFCDVIKENWITSCEYITNSHDVTFAHFVGQYDWYGTVSAQTINVYVAPHPAKEYAAIVVTDIDALTKYSDVASIHSQLSHIVDTFSFSTPRDQSGGMIPYKNSALGIALSYPAWWNGIAMEPEFDSATYFNQEMFNLAAHLDEVASPMFLSVLINEPGGRGGYWGDIAWQITDENADRYCDGGHQWAPNVTCATFVNDNGVHVTHFAGPWDAFRESAIDINVYVIKHPTKPFRAVVLSDERLLDYKDILGDVSTQLRTMVDDLSFVTTE